MDRMARGEDEWWWWGQTIVDAQLEAAEIKRADQDASLNPPPSARRKKYEEL